MPMCLVVTRDVEDRYRGFLSSVMLEVAACSYVAPSISAAVRERVWEVMTEWHGALGRGSILMVFPASKEVGGLCIRVLGEPMKNLVDLDGILLVRQDWKQEKSAT